MSKNLQQLKKWHKARYSQCYVNLSYFRYPVVTNFNEQRIDIHFNFNFMSNDTHFDLILCRYLPQ